MVNVKIQNMTRKFGDSDSDSEIIAADDIDLTIQDGEFITLVGPSGCGKTTTLRCVAGLDTPTSGSVHFGDRDVTDLPPQERDIALLFQDIALYPHMTVRDNMAYGLKIAGVSKKERYEKVAEAAELLQITEQLDKKPADLSGGQQQRVALGRSIVRDPTVFLFDEPMSDLDAKLKRELRPIIQQVTDQIDCPVLYVTHDQEEAMTMSDRVAVINEGQIEQISPPEEIYNQPATEFVADFIGQPAMQFFDGHVSRDNGSTILEIGTHSFDSMQTNKLEGYSNQTVRVGVRPQHIRVNGSQNDRISATHILDEPLGDQTNSFFETEFGEVVVVTPPGFEGKGKKYSLSFTTEDILLFDQDSHIRIT